MSGFPTPLENRCLRWKEEIKWLTKLQNTRKKMVKPTTELKPI